MYTRTVAMLIIPALSLTVTSARAQQMADESDLAVAEVAITTGVAERQPVDNVTSVDAQVGEVYCWTRITGAEMEVQVEHVWYYGDEEMARVALRVAGSDWRTWSSKTIVPEWTGDWRVDIVGPAGEVLDSVSFTVGGM